MRFLARWRVTLGFLFGALAFWLATPTWMSVALGFAVALCGEAIRIWAAGHLEKSLEVTRSGPYAYTRHPLYLGSSIIGIGVAIASLNVIVTALTMAYLMTTIPAAIRSEELHLREKFGREYDAYKNREAAPVTRVFSMARTLRNREHHTIAGVLIGFALLALKVQLSIR